MPDGVLTLAEKAVHILKIEDLSAQHATSFGNILSLVQETLQQQRAKLAAASMSRHKKARQRLKELFQLNQTLFFFCALTIPYSRWATEKNPNSVFRDLQAWWSKIKIPTPFIQLAEKVIEKNKIVFLESGFLLAAGETSTTNQPDHDFIRSIPIPYPTADQVTIRDTNDFGNIGHSQTKGHSEQARKRRRIEERELSDVERLERQNERAIDTEKPHNDDVVADDKGGPESFQANLGSGPFQLKPTDVVSVIFDNLERGTKAAYTLTFPHLQGQTPFITMHCPGHLAIKFLSEREQVPWA